MPIEVKSQTVTYFDEATFYLTEEQIDAIFLEVRINILSYRDPVSLAFTRNPPQSVWGWVTGCYQECIVSEQAIRFDYERVYRDTRDYQQIATLFCIYYKAAMESLGSLGEAIPNIGQFQIQGVDAIDNVVRRGVDSFRFKGLIPMVFSFEVFWIPKPDVGECTPPEIEPDEAAPPGGAPNPPGPSSSSPGASPIANGGQAIGPMSSVPPGSFGGDFGPRNAGGQITRIRVQGQAINGQNLGCNVLVPVDNTFDLQGFYSLNDLSVILQGPGDAGGCPGALFGYTVLADGVAVASAGPAGFYDAPTITEISYP